MLIGEYYTDSHKPTIDGDWIRGLKVLGRVSLNSADTDGATSGKSKVKRRFDTLIGEEALRSKFEGCNGHPGPHKWAGDYAEDEIMGTFHNPEPVATGMRMDMLCKKIGESYHPQALALRDDIEHDRDFGGFSPLFEGQVDETSGQITTVDKVIGIDWVPRPGSTKSIMESESEYDIGKDMADLRSSHETMRSEHSERMSKLDERIGECEAYMAAAKQVGESLIETKSTGGGARTVPPPVAKSTVQPVDPFKFARGQ